VTAQALWTNKRKAAKHALKINEYIDGILIEYEHNGCEEK
jgi:hypothetical protein